MCRKVLIPRSSLDWTCHPRPRPAPAPSPTVHPLAALPSPGLQQQDAKKQDGQQSLGSHDSGGSGERSVWPGLPWTAEWGEGREGRRGDPGLLAASPGQAGAEQGALVSSPGLPLTTAHSYDPGAPTGTVLLSQLIVSFCKQTIFSAKKQ